MLIRIGDKTFINPEKIQGVFGQNGKIYIELPEPYGQISVSEGYEDHFISKLTQTCKPDDITADKYSLWSILS